MLDAGVFSAAKAFFEGVFKVLKETSERDRRYFDKIIEPSYNRFVAFHTDYIRMFRILDDARQDYGVSNSVIDSFYKARTQDDTKRDFFRYEIDTIVTTIEDADNRRFFFALCMYFIIDENRGLFFDDEDIDEHIESMLRRKLEGTRWRGDREFDTPSSILAGKIRSETDPEAVLKYKTDAILSLSCRAQSITEIFVRIRNRYYPN